jgi:TolB-like protein/DNA-binding winged helix-turn-helix (wHTH) protein
MGVDVIYSIGRSVIDTDRYEVHRDGVRLAVEPQVFDLILLLLDNREKVVSRDEIIARVWKGRIVSDAAISSRIKAARRALGDDGKAQSLIRTVHRRGIRLVADVTTPDEARPATDSTRLIPSLGNDPAAAAPRPAPMSTVPIAAPLAGDDDCVAGLDLSLPKRPSIVVVPFAIYHPDDQVMSDGLSLDIMTRLARTRWMFVIARGTAFTLGKGSDARTIARRLGVRYVLQGTVQVTDKRVRVHAALCDGISGHEVWADNFDGHLDDIFRIQDEIADSIVVAVESEIEQAERRRSLLIQPANLDAWTAYHRATWHMFRFTPEGYVEAERLLQQAMTLDPNVPRVHAGLSFVHWQRAFLGISQDREGEIQQAFDYANQALLLDPREPQAYWALGRAFLLRQDLDQGIQEIRRSVELNPNFAMGHYSVAFARMLAVDNKASEADVLNARRLSPYDLMNFAMLAVQAINATLLGRKEDGATLSDRAVRQPNAHYHISAIAAFCNSRAGRPAASTEYLRRLKAVQPGYRIADFLRAFPYRDDVLIREIRETFAALGLPA